MQKTGSKQRNVTVLMHVMYPVTSNALTPSIILQWGQHSVVFCSEVSLQHEICKNPQQKWPKYESDF